MNWHDQDRYLLGTAPPVVGDPVAEAGFFAGSDDVVELDRRLRIAVVEEVRRLVNTLSDSDAFDVIELVRQREVPIAPVLSLEPGFDGSQAVIELVALILLSRDGRNPSRIPRIETRPNEAVPEVHERMKRLVRLAAYRSNFVETVKGDDPLVRIAMNYQAYMVGVRNLQYDSVQLDHEQRLFSRPEVEGLLSEHLGFSFAAFVAVRTAIQDHHNETFTSLRDSIGSIFMTAQAEERDPTPEEAEILNAHVLDAHLLPGERAAFTAADIADRGSIQLEIVERVLTMFSVEFDEDASAVDTVFDFLRGKNELSRRGLIRDGDKYLTVCGLIGGDSFRSVAEEALKETPGWARYDKSRRDISEALAVAAVSDALNTQPFSTSLDYYAPKKGQTTEALGQNCADPTTLGKQVEADALFVIEDVAICLEVKARAVAESARRGDIRRLKSEIGKIITEGSGQANRLAELIAVNGGVWDANREWVDLSHVRETHSVVASLDYLGPLGVGLGELIEAGLVEGHSPAWIVSVHDLAMVARVVGRPTEFLLYLRRRTRSSVARRYRGADELDLFMLFFDGNMFIPDDPDDVHRLHPRTPPPTGLARTRHAEADQRTYVGTFTDPLDAWMYWLEGTSPDPVEKPVMNANEGIVELVDFLATDHKPGWFRIGADLLGLAGDVGEALIAEIGAMVDRTRRDGRPHTLTQGYATLTGYTTVFVGTMPQDSNRDDVADPFIGYIAAKRHQVRSDRALGLLLSTKATVELAAYFNDPPGEDADLDAYGAAIGLQQSWRPSKRRTSVSKAKQKRRKKRDQRR